MEEKMQTRCGVAAGCVTNDNSGRPSLRARVASQRMEAQNQIQEAMALSELGDLLDKHPDVARILDLIEQVKG